jgi:serine phosphatase RsbU (regulator of sigma subunit)
MALFLVTVPDAVAQSSKVSVQEQLREAQRNNDSLSAIHKDLQISEYRIKMEALKQEEEAERMELILVILFAVMAIIFMAFYANIRRLQLRKLKEAYDKLEETTTAKERIESELRIARDIQMAMLPHDFPNYPGLDIYAVMIPAKEVGGDLYDYVLINDMLYFCVGDVSGKGIPASLLMAQAVRLFRTLANYEMNPADIANAMNREFSKNNDNGMFITMFIGQLDLEDGILYFCNAGHNPPVLDGKFVKMEPNAPIGLWPEMKFVEETIEYIGGQRLFIYSDGLNEAENAKQQQFGEEHLLYVLRHTNFDSAQQVIEALKAEVDTHREGNEPNDDLTIMCLRVS